MVLLALRSAIMICHELVEPLKVLTNPSGLLISMTPGIVSQPKAQKNINNKQSYQPSILLDSQGSQM